jgi:hypothetical protein
MAWNFFRRRIRDRHASFSRGLSRSIQRPLSAMRGLLPEAKSKPLML